MACMTHLDICNTSYGKKKVESQTDSLILDHEKSGIHLTFVRVGGVQHTVGEVLDKNYNFALDLVLIGGLSTKL